MPNKVVVFQSPDIILLLVNLIQWIIVRAVNHKIFNMVLIDVGPYYELTLEYEGPG